MGSLWQGRSVPVGHRVVCFPPPLNTCHPTEPLTAWVNWNPNGQARACLSHPRVLPI